MAAPALPAAAGIPRVADINELDEVLGAAPNPANIDGHIRINSAFAYLDPVRHRPNLSVLDETLRDRLVASSSHRQLGR